MSKQVSEIEGSYLSYSRISKYRDCRYAWYTHYEEGLRIRGLRNRKLNFGILGHAGLEKAFKCWAATFHYADVVDDTGTCTVYRAIHDTKDEIIKEIEGITEEERVDYDEMANLAYDVVIRALEWLNLERWEVALLDNDEGTPMIECLLTAPIDIEGWDGVIGYLDLGLIEKSTGLLYIVDHKFRGTFKDFSEEETAEQFAIYQTLAEHQGLTFGGVLTFQIYPGLPKHPELTKKGALSKRRIKTDWETYKDFIDFCKFDESDYQDVKDWAEKNEFFRLTKSYRSPTELKNIWEEILVVAQEMVRPDLPIYRNLRSNFMCQGCDYKQLCLAELRGQDVEWVKKMHYRHKDEPNVILDVTEIEMMD